VKLFCYNDGNGIASNRKHSQEIDLSDYEKGFCRGFEYRSTYIEDAVWRDYLGEMPD